MKKLVSSLTVALLLASTSIAAEGRVHLDGVDPRVYLQQRKPEPNVVRELRLADISLALSILTRGPTEFLVDEAAYPATVKPDQRAALRKAEERALVTGALLVVAQRKPDAGELVARFLKSDDAVVRAEAAARLGEMRGDVVDLLAALAQSDPDAGVRAGACVGLGSQRSEASLRALEPFVVDGKDPVRQLAAVNALASLGSKWAWKAKGDEEQGARVRKASLALLSQAKKNAGSDAVSRALLDVEARLE